MRAPRAVLLALLLCACGAKSPPPAGKPVSAASDGGVGRVCEESAECAKDELCAGPAGCGIPWHCIPMRPCTQDMVMFCGCDGKVHQGSGTCPPAPYQHIGECD